MNWQRKVWLIVSLGLAAACAPSVAERPKAELFPIEQGEFLEYVRRADGAVYVSGPDLTSAPLAQALLQIPRDRANVVVLVGRAALANPASQVNPVARGFGRSPLSMVMVATVDAPVRPFALVRDKAFYGPGVVGEGEIRMAGPGHDYSAELEQFNLIPKRVFLGR